MLPRLFAFSVTLFVFLTLPAFSAEPAPDFTLPTFPDGTEISLKDFRVWCTWISGPPGARPAANPFRGWMKCMNVTKTRD